MNPRAYPQVAVDVAPMSGMDIGMLITLLGGARVSQMF